MSTFLFLIFLDHATWEGSGPFDFLIEDLESEGKLAQLKASGSALFENLSINQTDSFNGGRILGVAVDGCWPNSEYKIKEIILKRMLKNIESDRECFDEYEYQNLNEDDIVNAAKQFGITISVIRINKFSVSRWPSDEECEKF